MAFPHVRTFSHSLKMSWIKKLLNPETFAPWKTLVLNNMEGLGGNNIWYLRKEGLEKISNKINSFWKCVVNSWSQIESKVMITPKDILAEPIFLNNNIRINNKIFFYKEFCKKDIFFINDIIDDNGTILAFDTLKTKFNLRVPFLTYLSLVNAIPRNWRIQIKNHKRLENSSNTNVD